MNKKKNVMFIPYMFGSGTIIIVRVGVGRVK